MPPLNQQTILEAADRSVLETVDGFVRFRPGFHGDTGIRDYLYHRLMSNLPGGGTYVRRDGSGTLVAQAEWYTSLKYRKTGHGASRGRFDLGVANPEKLEFSDPKPLIAFECGRNKRAVDLIRDLDADAGHEGPEPADITKLAREIRHAGMPYGYALEFYDEGDGEVHELTDRLRTATVSDRLRVVALAAISARKPALRLFPEVWAERVRSSFAAELERIGG